MLGQVWVDMPRKTLSWFCYNWRLTSFIVGKHKTKPEALLRGPNIRVGVRNGGYREIKAGFWRTLGFPWSSSSIDRASAATLLTFQGRLERPAWASDFHYYDTCAAFSRPGMRFLLHGTALIEHEKFTIFLVNLSNFMKI